MSPKKNIRQISVKDDVKEVEEVSGETSKELVPNIGNIEPIIPDTSLFILSISDDQLKGLIGLIRGMFKTEIN